MEHFVGYYRPNYHYERVPKVLRKLMADSFMKHRNKVAEVFNNHIDRVNSEWDTLGKPASFGEYIEDLNPEYTELIRKSIQPYVNDLNRKLSSFCKFKIGEYADIEGYLPFIPKSRLWVTFELVKAN